MKNSPELTQAQMADILQYLGTTMKGVPSSTPNAVYGHGPGGLFSTPGMSRPLFSAMVLPRTGLASRLPAFATNEFNPLFGIFTGVTATSGSEPTGVCDDPPTVGLAKLCTHSFVFGRFSRQSRVFDITKAGRLTNRAEFTDFQLFGNPFDAAGAQGKSVLTPTVQGNNYSQMAANEVAKSMFEMAVAWSRDFARKVYTGNPSNNTAGGGYEEFFGLDYLINTGYRDAITGTVCPAADSYLYNFNKQVKANATEFVRAVTYVYRNLKNLAARAGLNPVKWVIAMPYAMFYEITEIWPIAYYTARNSVTVNGNTVFTDSTYLERMRDDMRGNLDTYEGQYLLIDGEKVEVVLDDAITETINAGMSMTADMYFVPLTVMGGQRVSYFEYFNYDGPNGPAEFARYFAPGDSYYTTDGGRFMWHRKPPANFCVQVVSLMQPRMLLLTPYLAARIQNITYVPLEHERSYDPAVTSFFKDGGISAGYSAPSYFTPHA